MDKKTIQKRRMMSYFIEAAQSIIEEKGIENVTIREVSDIAGYNSATLYNYFENLDHLLFFASMKYLREYVVNLSNTIKKSQGDMDRFLKTWECFCNHSFQKPKIYQTIFFHEYSHTLKATTHEYYLIFPEELGEQAEDMLDMLLKNSLLERNRTALEKCFLEKFTTKNPKDKNAINEIIVFIYHGILLKIINHHDALSVEDATNQTLDYIQQILHFYGITSS
ncbi:TetR/AcrR family transcriptional regulator [Clostridiaceae bacterium 35-E11]